ncbi:MAG: carboxypeptidase-like regulatory domain-containing protein [Bacteroidia bacterium]
MKKLILLLLVLTTTLQAQTIKGKVTDQQTKEALAFVTILEEGTQNGTSSDIDGYFSIKLIN